MASKKLIYADDARRAILHEEPRLAYCIDNIPAVDAVEVVRCKDCKNYHKNVCPLRAWDYTEPDDFCSFGERKDNERKTD